MLHEFHISSSQEYTLQSVLGNPVLIRNWQINKLPSDSFSVDNAIIMNNSDKWPLMIDPQMQANIWIKQLEQKAEIKSIKPTTDIKESIRILKNCFMLGTPVIFEDCLETFDPVYDSLIGKQIEGHGNKIGIKLGDGTQECSQDFKFYMTTKIASPHYPPEI